MNTFCQPTLNRHLKPALFLSQLGLALGLLANAAQAHVVLTEPTAIAGSSYKASLRVSHGCNGEATTSVRVLIPAGMQGAKPQPKAGWRVSIHTAALDKPYSNHGKTVTHDVVALEWQALSPETALPDAQFDEFSFLARLPNQAGPLWVKVLQGCVRGDNDWSQIPEVGTSTQGLKWPAALLKVQPAAAHGHHH